MPAVVAYTLSKISIKRLTARFPFPETFCILYISRSDLFGYIFYRVFIGEFVELYFISFQSSLSLKFLRSSDVRNWSNHCLKELYRFRIIFENASSIPKNAPIYIGCALQWVINYLSNFWAFSSRICGDRCNEIWLRFPKHN